MQTPNIALPLLAPAQAQKHVTLNESLHRLDAVVQMSVISRTVSTPPALPTEGERYLVPPAATGSWTGQTHSIALFSGGSWTILPPAQGWTVWVQSDQRTLVWNGVSWIDLPAVFPASVPQVGINASADSTNRLSVASAASLFNHNGAGHQIKVNKSLAGDTASLLFQTGFSGRAEIGLAGNDSLAFKVSADGTLWKTALTVNPASGAVALPNTPRVDVRQMTHVIKADAFSTTSATPVAVPGLSVTLTPASAPCRMRISGSITVGGAFWFTMVQASVFRNGVKIWPLAADALMESQLVGGSASLSDYTSVTVPLLAIDALATAAPVTYEVRLSSRTSGFAAHVNRRNLDALVRGESLLMVEELSP